MDDEEHFRTGDGAVVAASILPPQIQLRRGTERPRPWNLGLTPHPQWVEEIAFVCYVRAGRSMKSAKKLMESEWESLAPLQPDEDGVLVSPEYIDVPVRTLSGWKYKHDWDRKFNAFVADKFPGINVEQLADLIIGAGRGLHFLIGSVQGEYDHLHPATHIARIKSAELLITARGLGTFGSRDRLAPTVRTVVEEVIDFESKTEQELARITQEAIARTRPQNVNDERRRR